MSFHSRSLIVCAHGSRSLGWNAEVEAFVAALRERPGIAESFDGPVSAAFLLGPGEGVAEALAGHQESSRSTLLFPLLLSAAGHLLEDLPKLASAAPRPADVQLLAAPTPAQWLADNAVRRAAAFGLPSGECAVVLPYYGSVVYAAGWESVLAEASAAFRREGYAGAEGVAVGHRATAPSSALAAAVDAALKRDRHCLVVPLLLARGPLHTEVIAKALGPTSTRIHYRADAVLPDAKLVAKLEHLLCGR